MMRLGRGARISGTSKTMQAISQASSSPPMASHGIARSRMRFWDSVMIFVLPGAASRMLHVDALTQFVDDVRGRGNSILRILTILPGRRLIT